MTLWLGSGCKEYVAEEDFAVYSLLNGSYRQQTLGTIW